MTRTPLTAYQARSIILHHSNEQSSDHKTILWDSVGISNPIPTVFILFQSIFLTNILVVREH